MRVSNLLKKLKREELFHVALVSHTLHLFNLLLFIFVTQEHLFYLINERRLYFLNEKALVELFVVLIDDLLEQPNKIFVHKVNFLFRFNEY